MFFLTDTIFAILPLFIVWKLQRPRREKVNLALLMGLGIVCSAAVIPKFASLHRFKSNEDSSWKEAELILWSVIEAFLGIIAASIPALKSVLEARLAKARLLRAGKENDERTRSFRSERSAQPKDLHSAHQGSPKWELPAHPETRSFRSFHKLEDTESHGEAFSFQSGSEDVGSSTETIKSSMTC